MGVQRVLFGYSFLKRNTTSSSSIFHRIGIRKCYVRNELFSQRGKIVNVAVYERWTLVQRDRCLSCLC